MRKTLLVITVLLVATQAYAGTVTLSAVDKGGGWASIRYSSTPAPDANVSAFGLKIYVDSGAIITKIADYNVGECTATVQGYGIFPGTIVIDESNGVIESNGTPIAPPEDPCSHTGPTGLGEDTIIVEMGALYEEGNEPDLIGTLISVRADKECNVCVETESIRGNVVLTDANEAIVVYAPNCVPLEIEYDFGDAPDPTYPTLLPTGARHIISPGVYLGPGPQAVSIDAEPNGQPNVMASLDDITGPSADDEDGVACPVILVKGGTTNVVVTASVAGYLNAWLDLNCNGDWAQAGEQIFTDQTLVAGANPLTIPIGCGATSGMTYSRWRFTTYHTGGALSYTGEADDGEVEDYNHMILCHIPDVAGDPCDEAIDKLEAACFTIVSITTEYNDVIPWKSAIRTDPPYCTYSEECGDVNLVVSKGSDCYIGQPDEAQWDLVGRPTCWCYPRQCKGDADGLPYGKANYWVSTNDLTIMLNAWQIANGPTTEPGSCADFDRLPYGKANYRVSTNDLTILLANWQIANGPPIGCQPGTKTP